MTNESNEQLIRRCESDDHAAFETLVERHQVLVCSIAYSIVGNVASSEDVGQEVFLTAWKRLGDLRDKKQFKSWLSTIARNEARAWLRRRANVMQDIGEPNQISQPISEDKVVDQEETDLVWKTLEQLPESYREPLILYYRQDQSVSEVADALELSQSATKQRLARGREMLRIEVLASIEKGLRQSVPSAAFTLGVMTLISGSSKTAAAATGVVATKVTATAAKAAGGAVSGTLIGFLGAFFGAFASWYTAEYQSQRTLIVRQCIAYLIGSLVFSIPIVAIQFGWQPRVTLGANGFSIAYAAWMLFFMGLNGLWMFWAIRSHRRLAKQERETNAERLPLHQAAAAKGLKAHGRRWTSASKFFGLPLVQIAFPDYEVGITEETIKQQGTARAWVAIGKFAYGRVIAVGNRAIAPIAIGTFAVGFLAFGVVALGVLSVGVVSVAAISVGVLACGGVCTGAGMAAGFVAVAPMAFAFQAAKGAVAFSLGVAEGPVAIAPNANNEVAVAYITSSYTFQQANRVLEWMTAMVSDRSTKLYYLGALFAVLAIAQRFVYAKQEVAPPPEKPE